MNVSPRDVSTAMHKVEAGKKQKLSEKGFTHMAMQFGQFLDHDITLTPEGGLSLLCHSFIIIISYLIISYPELQCCDSDFVKIDNKLDVLLPGLPFADGRAKRCFNINVTGIDDSEFDIKDKCYPFTRYA